ncbi:MAG: S41 family peptidase [Acidobacteriota bacterium]
MTSTPEREYHVRWSPDSRKLVYGSSRGDSAHLYLYDFASGTEKQITNGSGADLRPQFSPDGKSIAFVRDGRELRIVDLASSADRLVATADIDDPRPFESTRPFVWSPDSHWIAFMSNGDRLFRNASVVNVTGGQSAVTPVSFLGNVANDTLAWSPDGSALFFDTGQRTEPDSVARVWLVPHTPSFHETQFRDLFHEETPKTLPSTDKPATEKAEKTPPPKAAEKNKLMEIVAENIRKRLDLLPIDLDVQYVAISPDGKLLLMIASAIGQENLFTFSLDELSTEPPVPHPITSAAGRISYAEFSPDSKQIFFLKDGQVVSVPADGGAPKPLSLTASMTVDFDREKEESFREAWNWERVHFHDRGMHGLNWEEVRTRFAPRVAAAATPDEFHRLLNLMVGELNASHLGSRSAGRPRRSTGRIGLTFDRNEYERSGRFRITEVLPLSPADVTRKISPGDYLLAIDGSKLEAGTNVAELLDNKIGREVRLTVAGEGNANRRDVSVQPVDQGVEKDLIYGAWVETNRAYIDRISGGKLGYVHMADMSYDSLLKLSRDLDAVNQTRKGVIFDIRNNNGGFVNAYALDILSRKHYLNMAPRGRTATPARTLLGQRSLERPTVLLTNRHSLSDAEDFSEGYRELGLGKIVGEPTAGWIIYTGNVTLLDGSTFRLPSTTISTASGEPMELHPRPVDIAVEDPIGEATDSQIDRAVKELSSP